MNTKLEILFLKTGSGMSGGVETSLSKNSGETKSVWKKTAGPTETGKFNKNNMYRGGGGSDWKERATNGVGLDVR